MRKSICVVITILCSITGFTQKIAEENKESCNTFFKSYLPKSYHIIDSAQADYNNDKLKDVVLVLEKKSENEEADQEADRAILILQKTKTGYTKQQICKSAILCKNCGGVFGNPYDGVSLDKNVLKIFHFGGSAWRWRMDYTFRFQNNNWELIGISNFSFYNAKECNGEAGVAGTNLQEVNFSTKKMHVIETEGDDCTPKKDYWKKVNSFKKVYLQNFDVNEDYFKFIK